MNCQEQNAMFSKNITTDSENFRSGQQDGDAKGGRREPSPHLMCFIETAVAFLFIMNPFFANIRQFTASSFENFREASKIFKCFR